MKSNASGDDSLRILDRLIAKGVANPPTGSEPASSSGAITVQDWVPYSECLEWRLGELFWRREGARPFVDGRVPFLINNSGWLARRAADLFLAARRSREGIEGPWTILELGAGSGLFARQFLDAVAEREPAALKELVYHVTDASAATVREWERVGLFEGHEDVVRTSRCVASRPRVLIAEDGVETELDRLDVAFANYALDSLPATLLRRDDDRIESLHVRTSVAADATPPTGAPVSELRRFATDSGERSFAPEPLLPWLAHLDTATSFRPAAELPGGLEGELEPGRRAVFNDAALDVLRSWLGCLRPGGFVLIQDFGPVRDKDVDEASWPARFSGSVAWPINFAWLQRRLEADGFEIAAPRGERHDESVHARMVGAGLDPDLAGRFAESFADRSPYEADEHQTSALAAIQAGRPEEALRLFRQAVDKNPEDWSLLGRTAQFLNQQLLRHEEAETIARAALRRNPATSPFLWNTLGNCLYCRGDREGAHRAYRRALRIHPGDAQTNLNLAYTWIDRGRPRLALRRIAAGLAGDLDGQFRTALLVKQKEILERMDARETTLATRLTQRQDRFRGAR